MIIMLNIDKSKIKWTIVKKLTANKKTKPIGLSGTCLPGFGWQCGKTWYLSDYIGVIRIIHTISFFKSFKLFNNLVGILGVVFR